MPAYEENINDLHMRHDVSSLGNPVWEMIKPDGERIRVRNKRTDPAHGQVVQDLVGYYWKCDPDRLGHLLQTVVLEGGEE